MAFMFDSPLWVNTLLRNPKVRRAICNQHFKKFDSNCNGQLEEAELISLVSSVCEAMKVSSPSKDDLHKSFRQFDKSKSDGLNISEFALFFEHFLRCSLPLMDVPEESVPEESAKQTHASGRRAAVAGFVPSSAPDAKVVTVTNMAGSPCWGPVAVDAQQSVWELTELVSKANGSVGVQLLFEDRILEEQSLPLASLTDALDLHLNMYVLTAESLIRQALEALQNCPSTEQIGMVATTATNAYSGSDMVMANPENLPEYCAWVDTSAKVVIRSIEKLAAMRCKDPAAKDLLLKCLDIPPNDEVWDNGGWGHAMERLPDALTLAAAQALPALVETGDFEVSEVCTKWIRRAFCFHGYFSFAIGDHPCTTSAMDTVLAVLKALPSLFTGTKFQRMMKSKVAACTANYMRYIEDCEKFVHADEVWTLKEANEWKVERMFNAIMSLTDADHSSKKYNNPWWEGRGYEFPLTGNGDDQEWMDEYMYKRTHRPQDTAFLQR
eukprot:TRINITY_DN32988_c0_g1_i1.p1 TRINITY_DN32988_c0_g1~~TRINITY_DN32988_c0_g1_i1.p1  ORF type:complete len:495 (-),score=108.68 TRINITY_DN32988_c0_g1_i1:243-1727(-)